MTTTTATSTPTIPEVGMGATVVYWSDREPGTIVKVSKSGKTIVVRADHAVRVDDRGMSDSQDYEYSPNPNGHEWEFSLRKNGRWVQVGETARGGTICAIGYRRKYYDFSF